MESGDTVRDVRAVHPAQVSGWTGVSSQYSTHDCQIKTQAYVDESRFSPEWRWETVGEKGNGTPCRSAKLNKYNHRAPYYVVSVSAFLSNLEMTISGEGSAPAAH